MPSRVQHPVPDRQRRLALAAKQFGNVCTEIVETAEGLTVVTTDEVMLEFIRENGGEEVTEEKSGFKLVR
jgi:hypothetical protein